MKRRSLIGDVVGGIQARRTGVVVVALPCHDRSIVAYAALDVDDSRGTEISPGKFFFPGPCDFDGLARGFRKTGRFDGGIAGVLPSVGRTGVGRLRWGLPLGFD